MPRAHLRSRQVISVQASIHGRRHCVPSSSAGRHVGARSRRAFDRASSADGEDAAAGEGDHDAHYVSGKKVSVNETADLVQVENVDSWRLRFSRHCNRKKHIRNPIRHAVTSADFGQKCCHGAATMPSLVMARRPRSWTEDVERRAAASAARWAVFASFSDVKLQPHEAPDRGRVGKNTNRTNVRIPQEAQRPRTSQTRRGQRPVVST